MDTNLEEALMEAVSRERAAKTTWQERRRELRQQMKDNERWMLEAQADKREAVVMARAAGMSVGRIAKLTGLTRQRVYQILAAG